MTDTAHGARPSDRLWGAVRIWAWLFMASAALGILAFSYRVWLLSQIPGDAPMSEYDLISDYLIGADSEVWITAVAGLSYFLTYVIGAFLVLKWYLRSVRNARALSNGVETSPKWAIWWFIIPLVSLWKPYSMTSELWRSSEAPDRWKGARDPALLRWWWGTVLAANFVGTATNIMSRAVSTAAHVLTSDTVLIACYVLQIAAGLLFLRIGGPISRRQTGLIAAGRSAPATATPAWAP